MKYEHPLPRTSHAHNLTKFKVVPIVSQALTYARDNPEDVPSLYVLEDILDGKRGNEVRTVTW
jgi:hypothetical protein